MSNNTYVCPFCERQYTLGVNGTVEGCDECTGIARNALDNTIIDLCCCVDLEGDNPQCPRHGKS